jgi:hypothetical protein
MTCSWLTRRPGRGRRAVAADIALRRLVDLAGRGTEELVAATDLQQILIEDDGAPYLVTVSVGADGGGVQITVDVHVPSRWWWRRRVTRTVTMLPGQRSWPALDGRKRHRWR